MILVDTSVWIDHLRKGNPKLADLLLNQQVLVHPFIIGELSCGHLNHRQEIITHLKNLPQSILADHEEILHFIETHRLYGKGLGFIDIHLLASVFLSNVKLWSLDRALTSQAGKMHIDFYI